MWSHAAWSRSLGVDIPLLSDWNGQAIRAFGVEFDPLGMADVAKRSSFLIEDGQIVRGAWMLGRELPDVDAVIATARELSA